MSLKIEVYKNYVLRSDERNVIVSLFNGTEIDKKTKKEVEVFEDIAFLRTVPQALSYICEREVRLSNNKTWGGLEKEYIKLQKMIDKVEKSLSVKVKGE